MDENGIDARASVDDHSIRGRSVPGRLHCGGAILYRRLARGTFVLPDLRRGQSAYVEISAADFAQLLAGLPLPGPTSESPPVVHWLIPRPYI
ncbi:hypothetical protein ACFL5O_04790 [Myxococcota bacterium]